MPSRRLPGMEKLSLRSDSTKKNFNQSLTLNRFQPCFFCVQKKSAKQLSFSSSRLFFIQRFFFVVGRPRQPLGDDVTKIERDVIRSDLLLLGFYRMNYSCALVPISQTMH